MSKISKVNWFWSHGKVYTEITFENGETEKRYNSKPPPTVPSHDIAHFICGFHDNMEWDYEKTPNHIAEYNAVFMEHILFHFSDCTMNQKVLNLKEKADELIEYMKWFSEDYYFISKSHPSKMSHKQLHNNFLKNVEFSTLIKHFESYYKVHVFERSNIGKNYNIAVSMNSNVDYKSESLYNYLVLMIDLLKLPD